MAKNTVFENGDYLSLPVPDGTVSGDPVRVGSLNGVAQTDKGKGVGNPATHASVMLKGVHDLDVTLAAAKTAGDPVYISAAGALSDTNTDPLFGHLVEDAAATGTFRVRVTN